MTKFKQNPRIGWSPSAAAWFSGYNDLRLPVGREYAGKARQLWAKGSRFPDTCNFQKLKKFVQGKRMANFFQTFSLNRPHWVDSVIESPCPSVWMSVCPWYMCSFFLGLSLALRSHDQFQASHWSSPHLPPPIFFLNFFFGPPPKKK